METSIIEDSDLVKDDAIDLRSKEIKTPRFSNKYLIEF